MYSSSGSQGREISNDQIRNTNSSNDTYLSNNTVCDDTDKRDGSPMRYMENHRPRSTFQAGESKNQKELSNRKNVNFSCAYF